jgi:hypothetical protein
MRIIPAMFFALLVLQPGFLQANSDCNDVYQELLSTLEQEQDFMTRLPGDSYQDRQHLAELTERLDAYAREIIQCFIDRNSDQINSVIGHLNMLTSIIEYARANPQQFRDTLSAIFSQYYAELIKLLKNIPHQPDKEPGDLPGDLHAT